MENDESKEESDEEVQKYRSYREATNKKAKVSCQSYNTPCLF